MCWGLRPANVASPLPVDAPPTVRWLKFGKYTKSETPLMIGRRWGTLKWLVTPPMRFSSALFPARHAGLMTLSTRARSNRRHSQFYFKDSERKATFGKGYTVFWKYTDDTVSLGTAPRNWYSWGGERGFSTFFVISLFIMQNWNWIKLYCSKSE